MRTGRDSFEEAQPCPSPWPGAASGDIPTGEMTPRGRAGWLPSALLLLQLPGRWLSPSCGRGGGRAGAGSTGLGGWGWGQQQWVGRRFQEGLPPISPASRRVQGMKHVSLAHCAGGRGRL